MKKIVVLDGACALQNDLSFDKLKSLGNLIYYDRTSYSDTINRIGDAEILVVNKVKIDKNIIDSCPNLKFITVLATGYDIVDYKYAAKRNIYVANVPSYSTMSVAQHTFSLILNIFSKVSLYNEDVKKGKWANHIDFCLYSEPLVELAEKTLGIIGYGAIGKQVAKIAKSFGMNVIYTKNTPDEETKSLEYVLANSDILSLHCPHTPTTSKIINETTIQKMKNNVILINTSRGTLVDENAVNNALNSGKIKFYAADVVEKEPPDINNSLINNKKTIFTPHVAWATKEARQRLIDVTINNIKSFIDKHPINIINNI